MTRVERYYQHRQQAHSGSEDTSENRDSRRDADPKNQQPVLVQSNHVSLNLEHPDRNNSIKQYLDFIKNYDYLEPQKIEQRLRSEGVDTQSLSKEGIRVISGSQQFKNIQEDYYRIIVSGTDPDHQRVDYVLCISKFQIPLSVRIYNSPSGLDDQQGKPYGKGGFGQVYVAKEGEEYLCLKRMTFRWRGLEE